MRVRKVNKSLVTERKIPTEKECGLYLVGSVYLNPHTKKEKYFVKVGMSKNLKSRVNSYKTENPGIWQIDYKMYDYDTVGEEEINYHEKLEKYEIDLYSDCEHSMTEWTQVSRKNYLKICKQGFDFFN